jgi:hypothetical protein
MSLMPLQAVPVPRTPPGLQTSRTVDHSAWVRSEGDGAEQSYAWKNSPIQIPFEDAGANQSFVPTTLIPFEDAGAEQSFRMGTPIPFEDAGAEQSWGTSSWNSLDYPFEG